MAKKTGMFIPFKTETIVKRIKNLMLSAYAEEPTTEPTGSPETDDPTPSSGGNSGASINFEELISKARKEEKAKQYKTIEKLKTQISTLTEQHNQDLLKMGSLDKEIEELNKKLTASGKDDSEEVKKLKEQLETLSKEKETLESKVKDLEGNPVDRAEIEKEIREELEKEYAVKTHKAEILAQHSEDLLLPELVFGNTVEELDTNLEIALKRSEEIREKVGGSKKQKKTPKTTNPSVNSFNSGEYSLEYLATLDPSSQEYREVRKKLGLK